MWIQERRDAGGVEMPAEGRLEFRVHYTRVSSSVTSTFRGVSVLPAGGLRGASSAGVGPDLRLCLRSQCLGQSTVGQTSHILCQVLKVRTQSK